jgi:hypothetical protein
MPTLLLRSVSVTARPTKKDYFVLKPKHSGLLRSPACLPRECRVGRLIRRSGCVVAASCVTHRVFVSAHILCMASVSDHRR